MLKWTAQLKTAKEQNWYPKNESACHNYSGCQYKELCSSCDDENVMETVYIKDPDPLGYLDL